MNGYIYGVITTNAGSTGVTLVIKLNGSIIATPQAVKAGPGTYQYCWAVPPASGYTVLATCVSCSNSAESSPPQTVTSGGFTPINVTVPCTC